ncbi:MAG: methionine--tRNA ligase [Pseudomonadota bacterium]
MSQPRTILVTSALPYANGPLHLGHIVEAVQTDIWCRFQRMRGNACLYVCAEDCHGTPIMIRARQDGITPEALVAAYATEHQRDYAGFQIAFDHFHSTHSEENRRYSTLMYEALRQRGSIARRVVRQAYDETAGMFLPDRFVRGTCPRCGTADQYGDSCENCGATYSPEDLKDAVSTITGTKPVLRDSEHLFFKLGDYEADLREWLAGKGLQTAVRAKLDEWLETGLKDWDISRDAPYFGFEIPDAPGKFFYVWFDAPVGYIGSFAALAAARGLDFDKYWKAGATTELHHFIGKDISYFHTLFWPAMLQGSGFRRPTGVHVHGFLTVDGQKMSKSRGTNITARRYLDLLPSDHLRYYFAAKLGNGLDDIDFTLEDFCARVNSDIVGKLVNIASRCAPFIERGGGKLADRLPDPALYESFSAAAEPIAALYESRDYAGAIREIMALADRANQYVDQQKPWVLAKDAARLDEARAVATQGINLFRVLMTWLAPVMPGIAANAAQWLGCSASQAWHSVDEPLLGAAIAKYPQLAARLDPVIVKQLVAAPTPVTSGKPVISIDDFAKLDLRAALVLEATRVAGSDKLLQLKLDLGTEQRNVFSGISASYAPESLVGRYVVMIANLAPRKMRFGVSEGMVLCASGNDSGVFLLSADAGVTPGMKIS